MAKHRNSRSKNFGFGNNPVYAAKMALRKHYGGGHYATTTAHVERFRLFCEWLFDRHCVRDVKHVTVEVLFEYALYLRGLVDEGRIMIATAVNRVSTVNVVLQVMRQDQKVRIAKVAEILAGNRSYIRRSIPDGMNYLDVRELHLQLISEGFARAAAIVLLARATGMRLRECILADLPRLCREADKIGSINIQDGCKGGRSGAFAPRWISVTDDIINALIYASEVSPAGSKNLLSPGESYIQFLRREMNLSRSIFKAHGVKGPHELRAAFACSRYQELVGAPAPVFSSPEMGSSIEGDVVRGAREAISRELGHGRTEITNAYLGSESR